MLKGRHQSSTHVMRGFVSAGETAVHFRWAGAGPTLLALHESPRSSASLLPLLNGLASHRTVIALDTPGYGLSDGLPGEAPEPGHYATAFANVMDNLGLKQAAVYGAHTGAALATNLAIDYPGRVTSLCLDGLAAFDEAERKDFLGNYLVPFVPTWDGTHVARLWSQCKDLFTWFPWNRREPRNRLAIDPPGSEALYDIALGFLMAGPGYAKGYRCAALLDAPAAIGSLRLPTEVLARPRDLLRSHLDRIPTNRFTRITAVSDELPEWLSRVDQCPASGPPAADLTRSTRVAAGGGWDRVLVAIGEGYLHVCDRGAGDTADIVIPDIPDSAWRLARTLGPSRGRVVVIDPPGCGHSDPWNASSSAICEVVAKCILVALERLGIRRYRLLGIGLGGIVAHWLASSDERAPEVVCADLPGWATGAAPVPVHNVVPNPVHDTDGASLITSWYQLRDRVLYDDAGEPQRRQRRAVKGLPTGVELHSRHVALWMAPESATVAEAAQHFVRAHPTWHLTAESMAAPASREFMATLGLARGGTDTDK